MKHTPKSPLGNSELRPFLTCKDHSVSQEEFLILKDNINDLLVTSPQPEGEQLSRYYESQDYISHTDAKSSLFDRVYQMIRSFTLKRKLQLINSFKKTERSLLDVGAGTGDFLSTCQQDGWQVFGIEPNEKARQIAEGKLGLELKSDLEEMKANQYDVITLWHVLEHLPNLTTTITALETLLKPDGHLIIAVPNHKSFDAAYYGAQWAAYDVPRHLWHFSRKAIATLLNQHQMKVIQELPMKFDAYYVSLLSEKYKTGKMNPIKALTVGMRSNFKARSTKEYSSLIYVVKRAKNEF